MFKEESLANKFLSKGFWLYLFTFITAPAAYFIRVIISNTLSVGDVGVLYSIVSFITIISVYNDFGLTQSLQYFLPKYWIGKKYDRFKTAIYLSLIVQAVTAGLIIVFLYFGAPYLAEHYFESKEAILALRLFCIYFFCVNIFQVMSNIYLAFQDTFYHKIFEFIRMWLVAIFTISFWLSDKASIVNFTIAWVGAFPIILVLSVVVFYKKYSFCLEKGKFNPDKSFIKEYAPYALWVFLGFNISSVISQFDQQMVLYYLGSEQAGYYANYLSLTQLFVVILSPILGFLFPVFTELISRGDKAKVSMLQDFIYKFFIVFAFAAGAYFAIMGPTIATVLYGEKFYYSGQLLQFFAPFTFLAVIISVNYSTLSAMGKVKNTVLISLSAGLVNFVSNIILIQMLGSSLGAIIGTVLSMMIISVLSFLVIIKSFSFKFDYGFLFKNIFFILVFIGITYFLRDIFAGRVGDDVRYNGLIFLIINGALYGAYLCLINIKEVKMLLAEVRNNKH